MLFHKHKTLAHFQTPVYGTILPTASEYVDDTIKIVLFNKHNTFAHFKNGLLQC